MLHRLEIENFYSIRDPQIIDLRVAANVPDEDGRLAPIWRDATERAPKVVALFGANASGKSNVLKALSFLAWFIKDSFQAAPEVRLSYQRFNDETARDLPTRFALYFAGPAEPERVNFDGTTVVFDRNSPPCGYVYEVSFGGPSDQPQHVLSESLRYSPPDAGRQVRLFERDDKGVVRTGRAFSRGGFHGQALERVLQKVLRPKASVASTLAQFHHPLSMLFCQAAASVARNIFVEKHDLNEDAVAQLYVENPELLELLNHDIERIGLGVRAMRVQQGANGPVTVFDHEGLAGPLLALNESHGTRQFIKIFPFIALALASGGLAVIDELDLAIHPHLLPEILRWFRDPIRNPRDAQLWMTCQNPSLLEELTKEEIWFCEKDTRGRTTVYGLRDIQAVRRGDNYYRKYLGGVYGAVPHLG
jgi:uncharacterized protein